MRTLACLLLLTGLVLAQPRPYIGYAYPAGGRQGATFTVRLGGQNMDDVTSVLVTGQGVTTRIVDYYWRQNNQEQQLLNEEMAILKKKPADSDTTALMSRIQRRTDEWQQTPACASIAALLFVEITVAPDAPPGEREIRVATVRGVSNPLPFEIGQLPEYTRLAMKTATIQILGKEAQALRKRPADQVEDRIELPATLNGQIASGEMNRYRFAARKGQRLLFSTQARQLIPFIADAVPGWFQPVMILSDANGREVAYNDDYRFKPDPTIFYQVPQDGEYVLAIYDSIYRGREDFVYRITAGELPFVTSIFPLGSRAGDPVTVSMKGWNLDKAVLTQPNPNAGAGVQRLTASTQSFVSNPLPFALDTLPEFVEREPDNDLKHAYKVTLPAMINGRIDRPGDWDVFAFSGKKDQNVVAEVYARRLDSPLDSVLKLTDAKGAVLAFNDDHEDIGSGANTHHADSYLTAKLPADGVYFVHIGDTAHHGGDEYAYRLRISQPQPDFELRVVTSSITIRSKAAGNVSVYVIRKDGFNSPIKLTLKDPPPGITANPATIGPAQAVAGLNIRTTLTRTDDPFPLIIEGRAMVDKTEIVHQAVPAEDRMQAFLWRHLVPAQTLQALVFDPAYQPQPRRVPPPEPAARPVAADPSKPAPKFTAQQVASRLRDLKRLYGAGYLTDEFYFDRVAECQVSQ
jgi:hypothetical protein